MGSSLRHCPQEASAEMKSGVMVQWTLNIFFCKTIVSTPKVLESSRV